jgi:hypothetical protein
MSSKDEQEQRGIRKFDVRLTNCLADWSLGLGVLTLFLAVMCLPVFSVSSWPPRNDAQWRAFKVISPLGIPAIILGVLAIARLRREQPRKSVCRAIAGVILGTLTIAVAGTTVLSYTQSVHLQERRMEHNSWLHALAMVAEMYCEEHGGRFPPATHWNDALRPYVLGSSWPTLLDRPPFAMNRRLSGLRLKGIKKPDETVLFFDSAPGRNLSGGPELLPHLHDWPPWPMVVFVDGGSQSVTAAQKRTLKWNP